MKVTTKGQVTIPLAIREQLGIHPGSDVEFEIDGASLMVRYDRMQTVSTSSFIDGMLGKGTVNMTTDEIMRLTRGDE